MSTRRVPAFTALIVLAIASGLAGCAPASSPPAAKPVVLHLATDDPTGNGLVSETQIQFFADQVGKLSNGRLTVKVSWNVNNDVAHDWDQAAAKRVIDGDHELGIIPSRAFDLLGVTSLQALSVPMLITDDALADTVAGSKLTSTLLSGLDKVGLTGLGIVPESLRHPFDLRGGGLVSPNQFVGATIRAPHSAATDLLFTTMGGTAVDDEPDPAAQAGQDSDYGRGPTGVSTGDVVWYPKFNVVVANSKVLAGLSATQRSWLRQAAEKTRVDAVTARPSDAQAAALWCGDGGTIVAAGPAGLAAFTAAVAPVRAQLASDPTTSKLIDGIQALKEESTPTPPVTTCP